MDMQLDLATPFDMTAAQFATAAGITATPPSSGAWAFYVPQDAPTGLVLTAAKLTGTPSAVGGWEVYVITEDRYGNQVLSFPVMVNVVDPNAPEPEPEPEPEPGAVEDPLAKRVAAHIGRRGDEATIQQATDHLATIRAFVWGYTRGRGFTGGDIAAPLPPVEAVIVSSCTRLTANPEQVTSYTAGDYSERGVTLQGFILPELAVLNRYRRRAA